MNAAREAAWARFEQFERLMSTRRLPPLGEGRDQLLRAANLEDLKEHVRLRSGPMATRMNPIDETWPHLTSSSLRLLEWMRCQSFDSITFSKLHKQSRFDGLHSLEVGAPVMELYGVGILESDSDHFERDVINGGSPSPTMWITPTGHQYCDLRWPVDSGWMYRLFGAGDQLLYVGISLESPESRIKRHRTKAVWGSEIDRWDVRRVSAQHLRRAEVEAIRTEHPLHNIQHNGQAGSTHQP